MLKNDYVGGCVGGCSDWCKLRVCFCLVLQRVCRWFLLCEKSLFWVYKCCDV